MTTEIDRIANVLRTQTILRQHDFNLKKRYGQNFLTDSNILEKIVATAALTKQVNVLEIGPGIGSLTQYLLEAAAEVMAVEIDKSLIPILTETLSSYDNFQLVNADVLKLNLAEQIQQFRKPELPLKVVANLPYYITTPILMHLIDSRLPFSEITVMMQKEVADRIAAKPSTKAYGSLTIAVQYYMEAEVAFNVPKTVFVPAPNVDSAILHMVRRPQPLISVKDEAFFFKLTKIAFAHRRKTLMNNLLAAFGKDQKGKLETELALIQIAPTVRAETLTISELGKLADQLLYLQGHHSHG